MIGAAVGTAAGALAGYLVHKNLPKKKGDVPPSPLPKTEVPFLNKPEVRRVWIGPKIEDGGRQYIEGHYIYIIDKASTWTR